MARTSTTDDVKRLLALGLTPGEILTWEAMEEVLAPLTRTDRRFATIILAFRRYALTWHNQVFAPIRGVGLRVLHVHERATAVVETIARTEPLLKRAKDRADRIPIAQLEGLHLEEANHVRRAAHWLHDTACKELEKLATRPRMPEPTPAPPRWQGGASGAAGQEASAA